MFALRCTRLLRSSLHPKELTSASYQSFRRNFQRCTPDELQHHAIRLGKQAVNRADRGEAHALIGEACRRAALFTPRCFRDMCIMAASAQLYEECLQLFRARWESNRDDPGFVPLDCVVDAAFHLEDIAGLQWIAELAASRLVKYSREILCDFVLWRILWRLACLRIRSTATPQMHTAVTEAAEEIWRERIRVTNPSVFARVEERSEQSAVTHFALDPKRLRRQRTIEGKGFDSLFRQIERIARYNDVAADPSEGSDEGEMKFFAFCREMDFFRFHPEEFAKSTSSSASGVALASSGLEAMTPMPPVAAVHVETYYFGLVSTCRRGLHVDEAIRLYHECRSSLIAGNKNAAAAPATDGGSPLLANDQRDTTEDANMSESFLFHVFAVLQAARSFRQLLVIARPILAQNTSLSAAVWSQVLLAAGEEKDSVVARQGYEYATSILRQNQIPTPRGDSRSSMEYLLQTSLHALAKCHSAEFEVSFLNPVLADHLVPLSNEAIAFMMTQNALHAPDAHEALPRIREWMAAHNVPLSTRIVSLMFKVLLRLESFDDMMRLYQEVIPLCSGHVNRDDPTNHLEATDESPQPTQIAFKRIWVDEMILCSDRRRYDLSQSQRQFLTQEVFRVYGKFEIDDRGKFSTTALEGLRTQVAMLLHDHQHNPLVKFQQRREEAQMEGRQGHTVGAPPPPLLLDPRLYFFTRRPSCLSHTLQDTDFMASPPPISSTLFRKDLMWRATARALSAPNHASSVDVGLEEEDSMLAVLTSVVDDLQRRG